MENIVVGYLTAQDALDKRSWSGIHFKMRQALEEQFSKVVVLGPVHSPKVENILDKINKVFLKLLKKRYNKSHNFIRSWYYNKEFKKLINKQKIDVIFSPNASSEIALLKTNIPICYLSGTSFNQIRNYYSFYSNLSKLSSIESDYLEKKAIQRSVAQVFPSKWAAEYAKSYYKANNTNVIPYGANIQNSPTKEFYEKDFNSTINLLFLSVDWDRKGGNLVFEVLKQLDEKGLDVKLKVVGCNPPVSHHRMEVVPFLNKNKEEDYKKFENILAQSHILFLPTRAECFGIVFCESSAYGIPSIATDTGGVGNAVEDGVNGYLLPLDAEAPAYTEKIEHLIKNKDELKKLSETSRLKYENELNWNEWGKKMKDVLTQASNNK